MTPRPVIVPYRYFMSLFAPEWLGEFAHPRACGQLTGFGAVMSLHSLVIVQFCVKKS